MASNIQTHNEGGVYELITSLCEKTASRYRKPGQIPPKCDTAKMRSLAYGIILKKTTSKVSTSNNDPYIDLLSYNFTLQSAAKNTVEYKRSEELRDLITTMKSADFGDKKQNVENVLKLLISLRDTEKQDDSNELFQRPFSFGLLDRMLPKPPREAFGSIEPYSYYPSHVFELPYSRPIVVACFGVLTFKNSNVSRFLHMDRVVSN